MVRVPPISPPHEGTHALLRLRPRRELFRDGILAAIVFSAPVFGVAYVVTAEDGSWPKLLVAQAVTLLIVGLASVRYFMAGIWIGPTQLIERGFFSPKRTLQRSSLTRIVRAHTFGHGADPVPQLFVCDDSGGTAVRMRGQFWSSEDMDALTAALALPVQLLPDVVSTRELVSEHPGLPYWFERNRLHAALAIAAGALVLGAVVWLSFLLF